MDNKQLLELVPIDFGGGCSLSKADLLSYLIINDKINNSIDIGVYRGRSLLPQANAHKHKSRGVVYGVDPYDNELVKEKDNKELKKQINKFVQENDFQKIYDDVCALVRKTGLSDNVNIIRKTSKEALAYFISNAIHPGLIHIDGNHDRDIVLNDVKGYSAILEDGGYIIMDDVSWSSVKPSVDWLEDNNFVQLYCRVNSMNDYAVFTKNKSYKKMAKITSKLFKYSQY